jgi:colanic acid biosynthesis glycosyl transferase WcaI
VNILVVSQYFWPENFKINDLSAEMVNRGHNVTVLTGKPNYPDGCTYPEYIKNPTQFSHYEGVDIVRVPLVSRGQGSEVKLILNYISFALNASIWGPLKLRKLEFDVIFVFEPSPITVGIPAVVMKKVKRIPMVFWVLDLWPETLQELGVVTSKTGLNLVGQLVSFIYKHSDLVLGQSKAFIDSISIYCSDAKKLKYFPNWSEDLFVNSTANKIENIAKFSNDFKVLFAGNVGEAQDFPSIVAAAEALKSKNARVKIFVVGDGRMLPWVKKQIEEKKLQDIIYLLGRHSLESMPRFYASSDTLLVSLKASQVFSKTIPGKVQSYLMAGKPILGMLDGEGARVIDEANAGLVCRPGDYAKLAAEIMSMSELGEDKLQMLGENARNYAHREFDRNRLISQLELWFAELVKPDVP